MSTALKLIYYGYLLNYGGQKFQEILNMAKQYFRIEFCLLQSDIVFILDIVNSEINKTKTQKMFFFSL